MSEPSSEGKTDAAPVAAAVASVDDPATGKEDAKAAKKREKKEKEEKEKREKEEEKERKRREKEEKERREKEEKKKASKKGKDKDDAAGSAAAVTTATTPAPSASASAAAKVTHDESTSSGTSGDHASSNTKAANGGAAVASGAGPNNDPTGIIREKEIPAWEAALKVLETQTMGLARNKQWEEAKAQLARISAANTILAIPRVKDDLTDVKDNAKKPVVRSGSKSADASDPADIAAVAEAIKVLQLEAYVLKKQDLQKETVLYRRSMTPV